MLTVNKIGRQVYIPAYEIFCLSTDTKRTDVPNGSIIYEIDTSSFYVFDKENQEWSLVSESADLSNYATKDYIDSVVANIDTGQINIHICTSDEYDSSTLTPTINDPDENIFYLTPSENDSDMYAEWVYINDSWERFGFASLTVDAELSLTSDNPVQNRVVTAAIPQNIKDGTGTGAVMENTVSGYRANVASGGFSHAEGLNTEATELGSHAEGYGSTASGVASHAECSGAASGMASHAEGFGTVASGDTSHAQNRSTIAQGQSQTAVGEYNVAQGTADSKADTDYAFIIGNGTDDNTRSNAFAVRWDGAFVAPDNTTVYRPWNKLDSSGFAPNAFLTTDANGNVITTVLTDSDSEYYGG